MKLRNPVGKPKTGYTGSFDFAQDDSLKK